MFLLVLESAPVSFEGQTDVPVPAAPDVCESIETHFGTGKFSTSFLGKRYKDTTCQAARMCMTLGLSNICKWKDTLQEWYAAELWLYLPGWHGSNTRFRWSSCRSNTSFSHVLMILQLTCASEPRRIRIAHFFTMGAPAGIFTTFDAIFSIPVFHKLCKRKFAMLKLRNGQQCFFLGGKIWMKKQQMSRGTGLQTLVFICPFTGIRTACHCRTLAPVPDFLANFGHCKIRNVGLLYIFWIVRLQLAQILQGSCSEVFKS